MLLVRLEVVKDYLGLPLMPLGLLLNELGE